MLPVNRPVAAYPIGVRIFLAGAIIAVLYSLVQRTPWAPFPHRSDAFVLGLAVGAAIVLAVATFASREKPPRS